MKNKQVTLEKTNDKIQITYKRKKNDTQLQFYKSVNFSSILKSNILNVVGVSQSDYDILKGCGLILFNSANGKYIDVVVTSIDITPNNIKATNYIKEYLDISDDSELMILTNSTYCYSRIRIQKIDNIKEDYVVISDKDINGNCIRLDKFSFFHIFNYYTGESIIVKRNHIKIDSDLEQGNILLNKKQRTFLGIELPKSISNSYWNELISRIPIDCVDELALLNESYTLEDHFLKNNLTYDTKEKLKKLINKYCPPKLNIEPIIDSYCLSIRKSVFKFIADFYVGKATISLLCRRPYESDEGSDVVRMTLSNMNLLGIAEMDKVVLKYNNKSVKCRVLKLDDEKAFLESNVPTSLNYSIGVPAHIRKKLGLCNIDTAIKVDRDTSFIFKKSINEQIVPILLTLFSINLFQDPSIWKKALVSLLSIPIVVYLNLSSKRNMRG
ncbi:MAG: hypothetical protein NC131_19735 [Roseburia sp.]|nr:hypothetical protein [Roseburia sp.]